VKSRRKCSRQRLLDALLSLTLRRIRPWPNPNPTSIPKTQRPDTRSMPTTSSRKSKPSMQTTDQDRTHALQTRTPSLARPVQVSENQWAGLRKRLWRNHRLVINVSQRKPPISKPPESFSKPHTLFSKSLSRIQETIMMRCWKGFWII